MRDPNDELETMADEPDPDDQESSSDQPAPEPTPPQPTNKPTNQPTNKSADYNQTMATMADEVIHTAADDVTIPDFVEYEHDIPTLPPGTVVGKYTIDKVLGVGGMGAVYLATQDKPQRQVALKLIRPGVLSAKSMRRFDLEAEILGRLHHPNIAQIHEAGIDQDTGSPYFAMEYVAGQELHDYIVDQKLDTHSASRSSSNSATRSNTPTPRASSTATSSPPMSS